MYSPETLATLWDVSVDYIYKLIKLEKIKPVYKLSGRALRIPESSLKTCLEERKL
jgi:excisionase family DNA binding protein